MIHEAQSMDIRSLHVVLGRVRSASQLVTPNAEWTVQCGDDYCAHRTVTGSIYEITELATGRVYVGQTTSSTAQSRFMEHIRGSCNSILRAAMEACGDEAAIAAAFSFRVVHSYDVMPTPVTHIENAELKYFEMQHIQKLQSKGLTLFNIRRDAADEEMV
jgi:hypothetical protein